MNLASAVDPAAPAKLDPALRTSVNGQLYWVASRDELAELRARPFAYSGALRDPVSGEWFDPGPDSPRRGDGDGDQILIFASEQTASEFDARPS